MNLYDNAIHFYKNFSPTEELSFKKHKRYAQNLLLHDKLHQKTRFIMMGISIFCIKILLMSRFIFYQTGERDTIEMDFMHEPKCEKLLYTISAFFIFLSYIHINYKINHIIFDAQKTVYDMIPYCFCWTLFFSTIFSISIKDQLSINNILPIMSILFFFLALTHHVVHTKIAQDHYHSMRTVRNLLISGVSALFMSVLYFGELSEHSVNGAIILMAIYIYILKNQDEMNTLAIGVIKSDRYKYQQRYGVLGIFLDFAYNPFNLKWGHETHLENLTNKISLWSVTNMVESIALIVKFLPDTF